MEFVFNFTRQIKQFGLLWVYIHTLVHSEYLLQLFFKLFLENKIVKICDDVRNKII